MDTATPEKVAPGRGEPAPKWSNEQMIRLAERSADALVQQFAALAETIDTFSAKVTDEFDHPFSHIHDALFVLYENELPDLPLPWRTSLEAIGAMGASLFGTDAVPDALDQNIGSRVSLALRIAKMVVLAEQTAHFETYFIACAIAAKRRADRMIPAVPATAAMGKEASV